TRAGSGRRHYGGGELCDPQSRAFAETALRTLLERQPTPAETAAVPGRLASGTRKVEILGGRRWSAEGRRIGTRIGGLLPRYLMAKAARVPLIGYAAELVMALAALPLLAREQRALDSTLAATHEAET